ncbi:MAG: 30S ribosomal protein S5 [Candidatus Schekmanbacteria bacterium]|nr:MAG: 30S ribosomal protein S5 [Candidatus Schekmanbacteria bacterium]
MKDLNVDELKLTDKVVRINRVSKVVKGGKRFSFSSLVVVGDGEGHVGYGMGKANEVPESIRKAAERAKKNLYKIPLVNGTIPYQVIGTYRSSKVLLKPAAKGTGVIAGGGVRAVLEILGVTDILTKSLGSANAHNTVKATFDALLKLKPPEKIAQLRDKELDEII